MNHEEAGRYWNDNADAWTELSRAGYDFYRDSLNTPAFLALLPRIDGLHGIDIGCGEGHNTRLLAGRGATMTAIDISETFIAHARGAEQPSPRGIDYQVASAVQLPFADEVFDFATGFMSFMEVPEIEKVLAEAYRVLKPGAFLQFSIEHPCFNTPHRVSLRGPDGKTRAIEVGDYFRGLHGHVQEWTFGSAPQEVRDKTRKFRVPRFTRTLSEWINLVVGSGFVVEQLAEPMPDPEAVQRIPQLQDAQVVAYFLHVLARK